MGGVFVKGKWSGGLNFVGYFDSEADARIWCAEHAVAILEIRKAT